MHLACMTINREKNDPPICHYLPALHHAEIGVHADRCVPGLLHLLRLWGDAAAEGWTLLCVLFVRLGALPPGPGGAVRTDGRTALLRRIVAMADDTLKASQDWLRSPRTHALAWWVPKGAIIGGLFLPVSLRAVIWIVALIWMGTACILNAKRCGRTHCRFTGPYYLAAIAPVLMLGTDML